MKKKTYLIGIVGLVVAAAFAALATDKKPADQWLIRMKVGGKTVAEMRVIDGGALTISGDQSVMHNAEASITIAKGATIQFGGDSGKDITVKAEGEAEIVRLKQ